MRVIGADPFTLYDKNSGYYYIYSTSNESKNNRTFYIHRSTDLINFEFVDYALDLTKNNWGKDWFWAPECYYNEKTKRYFLFYSARVKDELLEYYFNDNEFEEGLMIGCATSLSPTGPFVNIENRPINYRPFDNDFLDIYPLIKGDLNASISLSEAKIKAKRGTYISAIDANLLFDNDKIYLYFSRCCYKNYTFDKEFNKFIEESNILCCELDRAFFDDKDGKTNPTVKEEYKNYYGENKDRAINILTYKDQPQTWENGHIFDFEKSNGKRKNRRWLEGSTTFKLNINNKEVHALTYSANNYENELYGVGIAFSLSPLGPFKKYENNPIIRKQDGFICSTGHGGITYLNNNLYYVFHGRENKDLDRSLYSCKLTINSENDIKVSDITEGKLI